MYNIILLHRHNVAEYNQRGTGVKLLDGKLFKLKTMGSAISNFSLAGHTHHNNNNNNLSARITVEETTQPETGHFIGVA